MKNLIYCLLDINILMQNNAAENKLLDCAIEAINYYLLV